MSEDTYEGFAERYDWMVQHNPVREQFFRRLYRKHRVKKVLDCACGTGHDLIMFHSFGCQVCGSDLSESMLTQAHHNLADAGLDISLVRADFRNLRDYFNEEFDAVVCLTNSINEVLVDTETLQALCSMRSVLRTGGILVFDQGQTDASMRNPPRFSLVSNDRNRTRFFVMEYSGDVMTVNVFDFIHTEDMSDFKHSRVQIRIRLQDSWIQLLQDAGFSRFEFFEDWNGTIYSRQTGRRLIAVAKIGMSDNKNQGR
jgi:glycine/sarcosine N-methyltransferase